MNALDLLDGTEPGPDGVRALVARALALSKGAAPARFPGKVVGAVFLNPSLRTRTSLESACGRMGVHPVVLQPGQDSWGLEFRDGVVMDGAFPEHAREAIPVLASYVDVLAVRSFAGLVDRETDRQDPVLAAFRALSKVPVTNLESARWHPLQGLADQAILTEKLGAPRGRRLVLTWAPHVKTLPQAVPNQVLLSGAQLGMDVVLAHPEGFDLEPEVVARARALAESQGGGLTVCHDVGRRFDGAQAVYAKNWSGTSFYGRREEEALLRSGLGAWTVRGIPEGAGFLHCLPVRRNVVVADAVLDGPQSWVQAQAAHRLWTVMAVLEAQLGADPQGGKGWPNGR